MRLVRPRVAADDDEEPEGSGSSRKSGAAKTALLAAHFGYAAPAAFADDGRPVAERFADRAQATRLFAAAALPAAAFTRPIAQLSSGERAQAALERAAEP